MDIVRKTFQYGEHTVTLETGAIARQATGAVMISMGDTVLLVTVVGKAEAVPGRDFFPLTVNYQEKSYASGKIPGGFLKREGRPSEKETLTSRLIDRPIRPLFPEGFQNDVQIVATVLSMDPEVQTDVPAIIGSAAALAISGLPFGGPLAAARVSFVDGQYVLNPSYEAVNEASSELNLVVAGTRDAVLMVESEAKVLSEEIMLGAVLFGHEQMQVVINAIDEFAKEAGKPAWDWQPEPADETLKATLKERALADLEAAYHIQDKQERVQRIKGVHQACSEALCTEEEGAPSSADVKEILHDMEKRIVRGRILAGEPRIDGRNTTTVRPISLEIGTLPRTHGSAVFTRGETQAIGVCTLGTERDSQLIDDLDGNRWSPFMLHYNFPPFCVGETGMMTGPKRREIGHGRLARRALEAVLPTLEEFPYVVRLVSEITESNGSSSMATVCASSLSMMDCGVPIKAPVAGIAMGLIKEGDQFAVLTDILGDEDHLGDMDFKVAGTKEGVTALQMDIKIDGITKEIMSKALAQAQQARLHILNTMELAISEPRSEVSENAPKIVMVKIKPEKIGDVIGKGGAVIKELTETTETVIDIAEDGTVKITGPNAEACAAAEKRVGELVAEAEVGTIYPGKVVRVVDFGAFVEILPGKQGLLHISELKEERVDKVTDVVNEGDDIRVKVLDVDRQGRIRLSMKEVAATEGL